MGAGGIIQNHAKVLLVAVMDPSIYNYLSDTEKDRVEAINAKAFQDRTSEDVSYLVGKLDEVCCP